MSAFVQGVALTVAYDGAPFAGWASQPDRSTVQDCLKGAILAVDPSASAPRGASRTDSGVHARAQAAAFDTTRTIPPRGWVLSINQHLPDEIAVRAARIVPVGFQPRFSNRAKRYRYHLLTDRVRDPFERARTWRVGHDLDLGLMQREALALVGTHDFSAFRTASDERPSAVRTLMRVDVERVDARHVHVVVEGTAFLHNMVRIIVGTLVDVATGRKPEGTIAKALASRARQDAGTTAPPDGLLLEHIDLAWPDDAGEAWP